MQRLFPHALLACISEGRAPQAHEVAAVTDKVWRKAFPQQGAGDRQSAHRAACAALSGNLLAA